jgi:uncharacterized tellurite resistance protein B-like protein
MNPQTRTVAVINQTKILVVENGEKLVPIKPICEALGIAFQAQKDKIETDEILASTVMLSITVAADGKQREMFCIPFKYVFGWLFTINPSNVKEEARESVIKYKEACYDALYQSFTDMSDFLTEKQYSVAELLEKQQEAKAGFSQAKKRLAESEKALNDAVGMSFDVWLVKKRQMTIFIEEPKS